MLLARPEARSQRAMRLRLYVSTSGFRHAAARARRVGRAPIVACVLIAGSLAWSAACGRGNTPPAAKRASGQQGSPAEPGGGPASGTAGQQGDSRTATASSQSEQQA